MKTRNFYLLVMGQFVSQLGSKITSFGLVLWAFKQSGSILSTSMLAICYLFPEILLNFVAGSISDKFNKKQIILITDSIAALLSLSVFLMLQMDVLQIRYLYVANFILGISDAFQTPAAEVAVTLLVPENDYMKISGIRSFCNSFVGIFAPIIATAFYAVFGLSVIIMFDLITFCFAFITLLFFVRIPNMLNYQREEENVWKTCKRGLQYLITRKPILQLIAFMAFVNFIAAIYSIVLAPMILLRTNNNDMQLGIVSSTIGIAGLIGSILVTKTNPKEKKIPFILNIMSFSFLVCNSILGIGRNYYAWMLAVFMGHLFIPFLIANVEYIMRTKVPIEMQGRVFSARNTLQYACIP